MDKNMYEPEYVTEFEKDGYHIIHSHYSDRAEYEVYDDGNYVDVAESMSELSEITSKKEKNQSGLVNHDRGMNIDIEPDDIDITDTVNALRKNK